jgi:hypothetical protein
MAQGSTARRPVGQQLAYLGPLTINFNDAGVATGIPIGTLPAGSMLVAVSSRVNVAFNAGTTNVLTVGTPGSVASIADASLLNETVGYQLVAPISTFAPVTADTVIVAAYTQTGTAATTGQAVISVLYIPPDQLS